MKKALTFFVMVLVFGLLNTANAALQTIGTARIAGNDYNLIYEDNSIDGGLVWLDYGDLYGYWQDRVDWASGLSFTETDIQLNGYTTDIDWSTGWRLPLTQDQTTGYSQTGSEMGHLYYDSLGKPAGGAGLPADYSPFSTINMNNYWSGTASSANPTVDAYYFAFASGYQNLATQDQSQRYALAVHPGTVSAVPIPSAVWLLGSALIGLVGFRSKLSKEGK